MYAWLEDALADDASAVVTANRRLARELHAAFAERQLASGTLAWPRPAVYSWSQWLAVLAESGQPGLSLPLRIDLHQSRFVWEECLLADIDDPLVDVASLARLCSDTWKRLHEWRVPLAECQSAASGQDQRIFARAAGRYDEHLRLHGWTDDARLPDELADRFHRGELVVRGHLTFAGFDRLTPQAEALIDAAVASGARKRFIAAAEPGRTAVAACETPDAELRMAGRWAREALDAAPGSRVAVIVTGLEQDALRSVRLLREGFAPGWQYMLERHQGTLNVSYGRRLAEYPVVHDALLMLRFLSSDLRGPAISQLLRSPFFGAEARHARMRLELRLRDVPDRRWSKTALLGYLRRWADCDESADAADWLDRVSNVASRLRQAAARQTASDWAENIDAWLAVLGWPGEARLESAEFQLINRWRDLLNEFTRLDLVTGGFGFREAVSRLHSMASETLFQPESTAAALDVLGKLEPAGMEFDQLWVTGMTASAWPPKSSPLALVSRELQQKYEMPDSSPAQTTAFAERVLRRLSSSARNVVFSYPRLIGDAEQMPSALLPGDAAEDVLPDRGWHAQTLVAEPLADIEDRVPSVQRGTVVAGGAATVGRQHTDPFSAFAYGRLGVRWMPPFDPGIPPRTRGSLVHDALQRLYEERPSQEDLVQWSEAELGRRVDDAVARPFLKHGRYADTMLQQLLDLERQRCATLLESVVAVDRDRGPFRVQSVESDVSVTLSGATFKLRCDRIDQGPDGGLVIIDYKTGRTRRFLKGGEPGDLQLVLYACALDTRISGLALYNVDSRETGLDGAGPAFDDGPDWEERLAAWKDLVRAAAAKIAEGDVRLNVRQSMRDARPLDVLSRIAELRRDA